MKRFLARLAKLVRRRPKALAESPVRTGPLGITPSTDIDCNVDALAHLPLDQLAPIVDGGGHLRLELCLFPPAQPAVDSDANPFGALAHRYATALGAGIRTKFVGMFEASWELDFDDASLELWYTEWPEEYFLIAEGPEAGGRLAQVYEILRAARDRQLEATKENAADGTPQGRHAVPKRADQLLGCLLGGALGDALGGPYENLTPPFELDSTAPLALSDDTQLTLATCEAIGAGGAVEPAQVAERFLAWYRARRITGVGASTLKALRDLDAGAHWALAGRSGDRAAGNGAAMRIAPLAFCLELDTEPGRRTLRDVCWITHQSDEAYAGALAVALAIRAVTGNSWKRSESLARHVANELPDTNTRDKLLAVAELPADTSIAAAALCTGTSGYVAESVPLALFAATKARELGLVRTLEEVIRAGGDTDTIASMAGQIAGAWLAPPGPNDPQPPEADFITATSRALSERLTSPPNHG